MTRIGTALLVATVLASGASAQGAASARPAGTVELLGPAGERRVLTVADVSGRRSVDIDASAHNVRGKYRGVPLGELLQLVGAPAGAPLRGPALAQQILVEASDGYRVTFAPAELDTAFTDKVVLLAYAKDGAPLDSAEGPFRVIVPGEKRPARWARSVIRVRVLPPPKQ